MRAPQKSPILQSFRGVSKSSDDSTRKFNTKCLTFIFFEANEKSRMEFKIREATSSDAPYIHEMIKVTISKFNWQSGRFTFIVKHPAKIGDFSSMYHFVIKNVFIGKGSTKNEATFRNL